MLACFVGRDLQRIDYVFSGGRRERIAQMAQVLPEVICTENLEKWRNALKDVEMIISTWGMEAWEEETIRTYFPRLKAVLYAAGSVQYFARPFLHLGVAVVSAWGAMATPVAEMTAALIVQTAKGFFLSEQLYRREGYDAAHDLATLAFPGMYDKTRVGLLGLGMIGRRVAELLRSFDVRIYAYDPFCTDDRAAALGVTLCPLEEIFDSCQVISNHIANNPHTAGMLDYRLFSRMQKNAAFINTGRGAQVVEADLCRALREEPLRCAVLDVTAQEPYPAKGELRTLNNAVLLPHIAGYAASEVHRLSDCAIEQLQLFVQGRPFTCAVTLEMLDTMA